MFESDSNVNTQFRSRPSGPGYSPEMLKALVLGVAACAWTLGGVQASPKAVPFYIFIGQSNSGWLGTAGLTAEQKAAYGGRIPDTEIWINRREPWLSPQPGPRQGYTTW